MKLIEIHSSTSRNENPEQYISHFPSNAPTVYVHEPSNFALKRAIDSYGDIRYGLFNPETNQLISYAHFSKGDNDWFISSMPSTAAEYQKQGWITLIFTFAVNHDHIKIMSDEQQTPEAKQMWRAFKSRGIFDVAVYNSNTNTVEPWTPESDPYAAHHEDTHRLVAIPRSVKSKHLGESFASKRGVTAARRRLGIHDYGQYGPNTSSCDFINW